MSDILDRVLLTEFAVVAYKEFAQRLVCAIKNSGLDPGEILNEQARENGEGGLVIYVDLLNVGRVEFTIPKGEWTWRDQN